MEIDFVALNEEVRSRLEDTLEKHHPLALVGAGTSVALGYPTWGTLVDQLEAEALRATGLGPKEQQVLKLLDDPLWRADEYRHRIPEERYRRFVRDTFKPRKPMVDDCLRALVSLPFRHVLTTNYDTCLDEAHREVHGEAPQVVNWADDEQVGDFFSELAHRDCPRRYVYLHGRHDWLDHVVLTEKDYVERYVKNDRYRNKLSALFLTHPIVFVGFSLSDPDLLTILRGVNAMRGSTSSRNTVLLGLEKGQDPELIRHRLGKYGVAPLFYDASHDHQPLTALLQSLVEAPPAQKGRIPGEGRGAPPVAAGSPMPHPPLVFLGSEELPRVERASSKAALDVGAAQPPKIDPTDPEKGQWGGSAEVDHRRLSAEVHETKTPGWFSVTLKVEGTGGEKVTGPVRFHLHPTFKPRRVVVEKPDAQGVAIHRNAAYGAFTVGVEADNGARLELDLSTLPNAPKAFREN